MKNTINSFISLIEKIKKTHNIITVCCVCRKAMRYHGKWIPLSSIQMKILEGIMLERVSHTYCTACYKEEMKAIHEIGKQIESEKKNE